MYPIFSTRFVEAYEAEIERAMRRRSLRPRPVRKPLRARFGESMVRGGARLMGADLTGAKLNGANLTDADALHANMRGADLSGANLAETNRRIENQFPGPEPIIFGLQL